ncbi:hypothetical protein [Nonomuraea diastatica]|nr:hypothetical protein [Nonomuraea diastatica]
MLPVTSGRRPPSEKETCEMYKEFAVEAVMWLVPVVVLIGLALLVTA